MKTYDQGYEDSKDNDKSSTSGKNSGRNIVLRYIESLSQEQIYRMIDAHTQSRFIKKKEDPTGREIMRRSMEQNGFVIQAKLEISQPEDAHEKQADDLANAVSENDTSKSQHILNEKPADVQTKGEGGSLSTTPEFDQQLSATKGQGQSLDDATKGKLEQHTGTDLSDVKIHTGSTASTMSEGINAKAFTHGQDIYFKDGNYNPKSPDGEKLLSHEVAHTVQQGEGVKTKIDRQKAPDANDPNFKKLDHPYISTIRTATNLYESGKPNDNTVEDILTEGDVIAVLYESTDLYFVYCTRLRKKGYVKVIDVETNAVVITPQIDLATNDQLYNFRSRQQPVEKTVQSDKMDMGFFLQISDRYRKSESEPEGIPDKTRFHHIVFSVAYKGDGFSSHSKLNIELTDTNLYSSINAFMDDEGNIDQEIYDHTALDYSVSSDLQESVADGITKETMEFDLAIETYEKYWPFFFDSESSSHKVKITDTIIPDNKWYPAANIHTFEVEVDGNPNALWKIHSMTVIPDGAIPAETVVVPEFEEYSSTEAILLGDKLLSILLEAESSTGIYTESKRQSGLSFGPDFSSFINAANDYYPEKLVHDQSKLNSLKGNIASLKGAGKNKATSENANSFYNTLNITYDLFFHLDDIELGYTREKDLLYAAEYTQQVQDRTDLIDKRLIQIQETHTTLCKAIELSYSQPAESRKLLEEGMLKYYHIKARESMLALQQGGKFPKKLSHAYTIFNELKKEDKILLEYILETELEALSEAYNSNAQAAISDPSNLSVYESQIKGSILDAEIVLAILHLVNTWANYSTLSLDSGVVGRLPEKIKKTLPDTGVATYNDLLLNYTTEISNAYFSNDIEPSEKKKRITQILLQYDENVVQSEEFAGILSYMAFSIELDNNQKAAPLEVGLLALAFAIAGPFGEGVLMATGFLGELGAMAVSVIAEATLFTTIQHYGTMGINALVGIDAPEGDFAQELKGNIMAFLMFRMAFGGGSVLKAVEMPEMTLLQKAGHFAVMTANIQALSTWMYTIETGELPDMKTSMKMLVSNINMVLIGAVVAPAARNSIDKFISEAKDARYGETLRQIEEIRSGVYADYYLARQTGKIEPTLLENLKSLSEKEYSLYEKILDDASLMRRRQIKQEYENLTKEYEKSQQTLQFYFSTLGLRTGQLSGSKIVFRSSGPRMIEFTAEGEAFLKETFGNDWELIDEKTGLYNGSIKTGRKTEVLQFKKISEKSMRDKVEKDEIVSKQKRVKLNPADSALLGTGDKIELQISDDSGKIIGKLIRVVRGGYLWYEYMDFYGSTGLIKNHKYNLNSHSELIDSNTKGKDIPPDTKILYMDFNIPERITALYAGLGEIMYQDAFTYFSRTSRVDGVYGEWIKKSIYKEYGGQSLNLKKFWDAVDKGMSYEEAAFETITGQWAKKNKYDVAEIQGRPDRTRVEVIFKKKSK